MSNTEIAREIKPIARKSLDKLFVDLQANYQTIKPLSIKYNDIADYFTFEERLHTIGIKNINFYEFYRNKEKYYNHIKNILEYYKRKGTQKTEICIYKYIFNLYYGSITNFSIPNVIQVLQKYKPTHILDPTCGFGNRMVGCAALPFVESYIGIDCNTNLEQPLNELKTFLLNHSKTRIEVLIQDCLDVDYSKMKYNCCFTSLPYYDTEIYRNSKIYTSKDDMDHNFYKPLIERTYKHLQNGGIYVLNVPELVYKRICVDILGECDEKIELLKRRRNNSYHEYIYVWRPNLTERA